MEFLLLGRVEAYDGHGRPVDLGRRRERCLLGVLLLHAGQMMTTARLIDLLWDAGDDLPRDPVAALRTCVSRLRSVLPAGTGATGEPRLTTVPGGYRMEVDPATVDAHRFRVLVGRARAEPDPAHRAALVAEALALWRGPVLAGVATDTLRRRIGADLAELRLAATELKVDAELAQGHDHELIGSLYGLVAEHPMHEPFVDRLMLTLYRAGRQTEALDAFRQLRARLAGELGTDPGPALQDRFRAILRHDPSLVEGGQPDPPQVADHPRTGPVPRQLPADVAGFVGRAGALEELDAAVDGPGGAVVISAVSGTAGVGKTALAVHWAHRVAERFPDGQLYVNLRGFTPAGRAMAPAEAVRGFLDAIGVAPERIPATLDAQTALYRSLLAGKRMLVVLDNARDAEQVRPLLPGTSTALALVTSRDQLTPLVAAEGARPVSVDVLSAEEARQLLAGRLGADRVAAEPEAVEQIVTACARLPLALVVAAARAHRTRFPLRGLGAELTEAGSRLDALDAGDAISRVRAVFSWSYTALTPPAGRLFRLLGGHPGPDISVPAAASLTGLPRSEAHRLLTELTRANLLVEHLPGRYAFHDLLRAYASERTSVEDGEPDRRAAIDRLYHHYLRGADAAARALYPGMLRLPPAVSEGTPPPEQVFADQATALAWLDAERSNLVAVITTSAVPGPRPIAWRLADTLRGYLWFRMYTVDWLAVAEAAMVAAEADRDLAAQAAAQLSLGLLYWRMDKYTRAIGHSTRALDLTRRAGWIEGQAAALGNLGSLYLHSGQLEQSTIFQAEALALNTKTGRIAGMAASHAGLGAVYTDRGRLKEAADHHRQALAITEQVGTPDGPAAILVNLGLTHHALGQLSEAADVLTRALRLSREIGDRGEEALALLNLAAVRSDTGSHHDALELAGTARAVASELGSRWIEADALSALATVEHRLERQRESIDHHTQALRLAQDIGERHTEIDVHLGLAACHRAVDQLVPAFEHARQALDYARAGGYRLHEGQALTVIAAVHLAQDHSDLAIRDAEAALAVHRETGHRLGEARARLLLGQAAAHTGDGTRARRYWSESLGIFEAAGVPEAEQARALLGPGTATSSAAR